MFFQKFNKQRQRKIFAATLFTGIFSGITGFFVSHFFNPKTGLENRNKISTEAAKAIKYADKTKEELLNKARVAGKNLLKKEEEVKENVKEKIEEVKESVKGEVKDRLEKASEEIK